MKKNSNIIEKIEAPGWDAIVATFEKIYPTQKEPLHYAPMLSWRLGGEDPLDGISVYDGGDYFHFVTFGFSELYEKESEDKEWSGYGMEFTLFNVVNDSNQPLGYYYARILYVLPNSPASSGGLERGDWIVGVKGKNNINTDNYGI